MSRHHRAFNFSLFTIYIIGATGIMIWNGIGLAPDRYAFIILFASLLVRKTRAFILDWLPFLFILISYDFLRGFADNLGTRAHTKELIDLEITLFGSIPTIELQKVFFNQNNIRWYDYVATIFYFLHFALAESFAFMLWIYSRSYFRQFITGLLLLSYAGWLTYIIYPATPPWLASKQGVLPEVLKVMDITSRNFPTKIDFPTIYHKFNPNPVAAIPSMHAAYPLLVLLFALKFFGKKALFFVPYVFGVWFSIVYLGEHYVIDVIIGALYAIGFYIIANGLHSIVKSYTWLRRMRGNQSDLNVQSASQEIILQAKIPMKPKRKSL